jgi:hypothetical protein
MERSAVECLFCLLLPGSRSLREELKREFVEQFPN